jgi:hypothetical protein
MGGREKSGRESSGSSNSPNERFWRVAPAPPEMLANGESLGPPALRLERRLLRHEDVDGNEKLARG